MGERYQLTGTWPCRCKDKANAMGVLECRVCHATRPGNGREVAKVVALAQNETPDGTKTPPPAQNAPKRRKQALQGVPNAVESHAMTMLPGEWRYEGRPFAVCGGDTYTPDWVDEEHRQAMEVKDEYIHSRDGRRRFMEAKHLYPGWTWIWCRRRTKGRKGPRWEIEVYPATQEETRHE